MEDEYRIPEVTPQDLAAWLRENHPGLLVLDVREPYEFPRASIQDDRVVLMPLNELARKGADVLPEKVKAKKDNPDGPLVVICHHGNRSAQVTAWLLDMGWPDVYNLAGGIDAYARLIDPKVGLY